MHPVRRQRLLIVLGVLLLVGVAVGLTAWALRENLNAFYAPVDVVAGKAPVERRIRVGGLVVAGSVKRAADTLHVEFDLTDGKATFTVGYDGILPDLFREGQGILATGELGADGRFTAEEVLAKHDENYMPPEVKDAIEKAGHPAGAGQAESAPGLNPAP
ncbi:MAG: cytochrome c maturation protein CcmE [Gammaproteobacteria bacterium]